MNENLITKTDGYKIGHWQQLPPDTENMYFYFESRYGDFDEIVFFGLQYVIKRHLIDFKINLAKANKLCASYLGSTDSLNKQGWSRIDDVGFLPISIKAVPEGTVVNKKNVLFSIENTYQGFAWLPGYLETLLSYVWYPTTIATRSRWIKKHIKEYLEWTGDVSTLDYRIHDFGMRGVSCWEQAGIGGAAHLVTNQGTDNLAAFDFCDEYYNQYFHLGKSINASEHSTITSWGRKNEAEAYENMLDKYPEGTFACVCDSYNINNSLRNIWGGKFKDRVLNRNGTVVLRLDSGDPTEGVMNALDILSAQFGDSKNNKGFRELPPQVRIIQGDGITKDSIVEILHHITKHGWSANNLFFGSGGGLLQKVSRDDLGIAIKCSARKANGEWIDVRKEPVGDPNKWSKAGKLKLVKNVLSGPGPKYLTFKQNEISLPDQMVEVFRDGQLLVDYKFDEVRERASL